MEDVVKKAKNILTIFDLSGEIALITGGARGLGFGMAAALAGAGADIAILDRSDLTEARKKIAALGRQCLSIAADVTDKESIDNAVQKVIKKYKRIDILVNSAGVTVVKPTTDFDLADWEKVIKVNLEGTFICCQAVGRIMLRQKRGKIINISSVRGLQGRSQFSAYAPSKAGVNLLTRSLACEWSSQGVLVNAIAPVFTRTEINRFILDDPEQCNEIIRRIPIGRVGRVEDLFGAVIFLASRASDFITGIILYADGGWTAA